MVLLFLRTPKRRRWRFFFFNSLSPLFGPSSLSLYYVLQSMKREKNVLLFNLTSHDSTMEHLCLSLYMNICTERGFSPSCRVLYKIQHSRVIAYLIDTTWHYYRFPNILLSSMSRECGGTTAGRVTAENLEETSHGEALLVPVAPLEVQYVIRSWNPKDTTQNAYLHERNAKIDVSW